MAISGNATTSDGQPVDVVRIFRWPDKKLLGAVLPDAAGDWTFIDNIGGEVGITYIAAGCQPITHGPYLLDGDEYFEMVTALLRFNGANGSYIITDEIGNSWNPVGGAVLTTSDPKFGTASLKIEADGRWIEAQKASWNDFSYGSGDLTIECWIKQTSINELSALFAHIYKTNNNVPLSVAFGKIGTTTRVNEIYFGFYNGSWIGANSTWSPTTDEWHHIAVTREGSVYRLFADGAQIASFSSIDAPNATNNFIIGHRWDSYLAGSGFKGQIDSFRITKGVARYVGNFVPPTEEI